MQVNCIYFSKNYHFNNILSISRLDFAELNIVFRISGFQSFKI